MSRQIILALSLFITASLAQAGEAARIVFVAGKAEIAGNQISLGNAVHEGDEVATGADGYIYLKTIDNGFLILRPNSRARIVAYHVDQEKPANTRIKLELLNGVARAISGDGAKQAKQNFRFNTPVAAIGVRGTDFTVYTDQDTSRIAVISGGVVVSGFSGTCGPEGVGPCEGASSRELFAKQAGQLLQVQKGQAVPQLLPNNGTSPDVTAPPRSDEPKSTGGNTSATKDLSLDPQKNTDFNSLAVAAKATTPPKVIEITPPRDIIWGRWQTVLDQAPTIDLEQHMGGKAQLIAINAHFALLRARGSEWQVPTTGSMNFAMRDGAAYITDESRGGALQAATLENGRLNVNFAKATFSTSFDLVSQAERFNLQAKGDVGRDGQLYGENQFLRPTNMNVSGFLSAENGGSAAYLFQSRLDDRRTAAGATYWTK
ncbi:MAG TPA: FecR family protein [Noviherbaspirillum sp.]|nr:FecR family protein [Noviherbaspirillum sp.]